MLGARKALEDYEALNGISSSSQHKKLENEFAKASENYLRLSASEQPLGPTHS